MLPEQIRVVCIPQDDSWFRDSGPTVGSELAGRGKRIRSSCQCVQPGALRAGHLPELRAQTRGNRATEAGLPGVPTLVPFPGRPAGMHSFVRRCPAASAMCCSSATFLAHMAPLT